MSEDPDEREHEDDRHDRKPKRASVATPRACWAVPAPAMAVADVHGRRHHVVGFTTSR